MQRGFSLRGLNTWNVGGACGLYLAPQNLLQACSAIKMARAEFGTLFILGGGSNVLICDGNLPVAVLHTTGLDSISAYAEPRTGDYIVTAGAGVSTKRLLAAAYENGWGGLEFLTGIPGTIGGALWGCAGAAGESMAGLVESVQTIGADGAVQVIRRCELSFSYRGCPFDTSKTVLAASCVLRLAGASRGEIAQRMRRFALLKKGQPLGSHTAGCVFKNPAGDSAGRMLDSCGCKGLRIGGAAVSQHHANFIENCANATAADIYRLCELCRARVYERYGVKLEYEIRFIGGFEENQTPH